MGDRGEEGDGEGPTASLRRSMREMQRRTSCHEEPSWSPAAAEAPRMTGTDSETENYFPTHIAKPAGLEDIGSGPRWCYGPPILVPSPRFYFGLDLMAPSPADGSLCLKS